jgi:hypothetical protein
MARGKNPDAERWKLLIKEAFDKWLKANSHKIRNIGEVAALIEEEENYDTIYDLLMGRRITTTTELIAKLFFLTGLKACNPCFVPDLTYVGDRRWTVEKLIEWLETQEKASWRKRVMEFNDGQIVAKIEQRPIQTGSANKKSAALSSSPVNQVSVGNIVDGMVAMLVVQLGRQVAEVASTEIVKILPDLLASQAKPVTDVGEILNLMRGIINQYVEGTPDDRQALFEVYGPLMDEIYPFLDALSIPDRDRRETILKRHLSAKGG